MSDKPTASQRLRTMALLGMAAEKSRRANFDRAVEDACRELEAACAALDKVERERLERCPVCGGKGRGCSGAATKVCLSCHGTGRRAP